MKSPNARTTFSVCSASSRVGDRHKHCTSRVWMSTVWQMDRAIIDDLPVPDCACAITSRPLMIGMTARCWMAEGFSKPYA
eukprot:scaffold3836_cov417-Prasinococcus_capsulatus_cf.AAC.19